MTTQVSCNLLDHLLVALLAKLFEELVLWKEISDQ
jgi:hypothetical protein